MNQGMQNIHNQNAKLNDMAADYFEIPDSVEGLRVLVLAMGNLLLEKNVCTPDELTQSVESATNFYRHMKKRFDVLAKGKSGV